MAKYALEFELTSFCEPSRRVVLFVGDELNTYCAKVTECELGKGNYRLADEAIAGRRRSTPVTNFDLRRRPDGTVKACRTDQLTGRSLEQEEGQVLSRHEVRLGRTAVDLGRLNGLLNGDPWQRGKKAAKFGKRFRHSRKEHWSVTRLGRAQYKPLGLYSRRQIKEDWIDHCECALVSKLPAAQHAP